MQVSAGYDAHRLDPLEKLNYESATYHALVSSLMSLADELCGKPLCPAHVCVMTAVLHASAGLVQCIWTVFLKASTEDCLQVGGLCCC